uniref:SWIM-type domain-containing protein n=1 Tax=Caenorhabditis tropicalis TaxID=1561998 RepID=A0A1I7UJA9_9PELO
MLSGTVYSSFRIWNTQHAPTANSGIVQGLAGQIQIDSTFDLSDCVITTITGDIGDYVTRLSGKVRHVMLGFSISSSKNACHHEKLAAELNKTFFELDPKQTKAIPSIVTDGEEAFKNYTEMPFLTSDTQILRCLVHRRSNYAMAQNKLRISSAELNHIFGTKTQNVLSETEIVRGIFNVLSLESMRKAIECSPVSQQMKKWLFDREDELFRTHSLKNRLLGGLLMNYTTTNRTECINSRLKLLFTRREGGKKCSQKLIKFMEEEKHEMCRAILTGDSLTVRFSKFKSKENTSAQMKAKILLSNGFKTFSISHVLDLPKSVWDSVDKEQLKVNNVFLKNVFFHGLTVAFVEKDSSSHIKVLIEDDNVECQNVKCKQKPAQTCSHLLAVFLNLSTNRSKEMMTTRANYLENLSRFQVMKTVNDGKAARRFKTRKFSKFSHANDDRTVTCFKKTRSNYFGDEDDQESDGNEIPELSENFSFDFMGNSSTEVPGYGSDSESLRVNSMNEAVAETVDKNSDNEQRASSGDNFSSTSTSTINLNESSTSQILSEIILSSPAKKRIKEGSLLEKFGRGYLYRQLESDDDDSPPKSTNVSSSSSDRQLSTASTNET